jgi:hypothetical protein
MPRITTHPLAVLRSPGALAGALRHQARVRTATLAGDLELARAVRSGRPLVAGPWLSEVGFEVLYWIPMLRRLCERHAIPPERVTVISRGGAEPWYRGLCGRYVDVLDHFAVDELRALQRDRIADNAGEKHFAPTALDREVLRRAGLAGAALLHPSAMYRRFWAFWSRRAPLGLVAERVRFRPLPFPGEPPAAAELPERYVAVKAYFSDCFPDEPANRAFLAGLVERLARVTGVAVLSAGAAVDEHLDAALEAPGVVSLGPLMTPRENLALQSRVIAGAQALVSTYGGFAYLGPFLGVPAFAFHSRRSFNPTHLDAAQLAVTELGGPGLATFGVADYARLAAAAAPLALR